MFLYPVLEPHQIQRSSNVSLSGGDIAGIVGVGLGLLALCFAIYQFRYSIYLIGKLRDKCSAGAIGGWEKYMNYSNSWALPGRPIKVKFSSSRPQCVQGPGTAKSG